MIIGNTTLALSASYGGTTRSADLLGQPYDDIQAFGNQINFDYPIKKIVVFWGSVIDGLEVTYNLTGGATKTVMHGASKGAGRQTEVSLAASESIVEVIGLHGVTHDTLNFNWGDQVIFLTFRIRDSKTGFLRDTGTFGAGDYFNAETRRDIYVRGPIVGFAGTANNSLTEVGVNKLSFYTRIPAY